MSDHTHTTGSKLDSLSDLKLRQLEIRVDTTPPRPTGFVPGFPVPILKAVVSADAVKALPVVLAIHRQLTMTRREWTPLNSAVWTAAGSPSSKKREAILRDLKRLPEVVRIEPRRTTAAHYRVAKGTLWFPSQKRQR